MAKYTLLEIVQKVLGSMDSDEVNSIADTVESMQVADIVEDVFYNLVTNNDIPEHEGLAQLEGLADGDLPNYLRLPDRITNILSVRYDKSDTPTETVEYRAVKYVSPDTFVRRMSAMDGSEDNVRVVTDPSGISLMVITDKHPDYWTSFDDEYMVFDSLDTSIDTTLQQSKTVVIAKRLPEFTKSDSFTPDIDDHLFPLLINECKSWAHAELKQTAHPKAEQQARRQRVFSQADRHRMDEASSSGPNYGRRGRR
jgi:hypothetical protein